MKSISLKQLEILDLQPLKVSSRGGNIYYSDEKIYKLFKTDDKGIIRNKKRKIEILSMMKDYVYASLPVDKIVDGVVKRTLKGYTMNRDNRGLGISIDSLIKCPGFLEDYLFALKDASLHLKQTHERPEKIVLGDATFSNIVVYPNQDGKYVETVFVDFDSIQMGKLEADAISKMLRYYFYYKGFDFKYGKFYVAMDKISYLLHFFYSIFEDDFFRISPYQYDEIAEQINTLYRLRSTFYLLRNCRGVPDVPYLHEVIDLKDSKDMSMLLTKTR